MMTDLRFARALQQELRRSAQSVPEATVAVPTPQPIRQEDTRWKPAAQPTASRLVL